MSRDSRKGGDNPDALVDHAHAISYAEAVVREANANRYDAPKTEMLARELLRLNAWCDSFSDMALKERRLAEERIKELQQQLAQRSEIATPFQLIKDAQDMLIRQNGCYPLPYDKGKGPLLALLKRLDAALEGAPNSVLGLRDERG